MVVDTILTIERIFDAQKPSPPSMEMGQVNPIPFPESKRNAERSERKAMPGVAERRIPSPSMGEG